MANDLWVGLVKATSPKYMKGASDNTIRRRLMLAMMKRKGRIEYSKSGTDTFWQVEYSQPPITQGADGGVYDFQNHDAFLQLNLEWRSYKGTDAISKMQTEINKGENALIPLFQTKQNRLTKAMQNTFAAEIYKRGDTAGRESSIHGLETVLTERTAPAATDRIAEPGAAYAGLTTNIAAQGGSWSSNLSTSPNATLATDWPDGQGTSEYDCLSPILGNWSSSNWGTGSVTWEDNCWRVVSQMCTWLGMRSADMGVPDIGVMGANLYQGFKNHEEAIRRLTIPHPVALELGFPGTTLNMDGCALQADFDCPANIGYFLNLDDQTISSLTPELFWMEGPDKDPRSGWSWLWGTGFFGNMHLSPRGIGKIKNFA